MIGCVSLRVPVNATLKAHTSFSEVKKVMHLFSCADEVFVSSAKMNEARGVFTVSL